MSALARLLRYALDPSLSPHYTLVLGSTDLIAYVTEPNLTPLGPTSHKLSVSHVYP